LLCLDEVEHFFLIPGDVRVVAPLLVRANDMDDPVNYQRQFVHRDIGTLLTLEGNQFDSFGG
jgi:hypothetical protein